MLCTQTANHIEVLLFCSATNKERQAAPKTGFFYDFKPREMLIKKWDKYNEGG